MLDAGNTHVDVKEYYGQRLSTNKDLQTNACCSNTSLSPEIKGILCNIEDEILEKFYGCGSPIPEVLPGCTVLDLGCGSGRDVYLLSKLVGEQGKVIGLDMTDEQLAVARKHEAAQMKRFGFSKSNVDFRQGYIENLQEAGIEDNSVDVVVSNCVINLSPDKRSVFSEIFRVLKPGGEIYFSDVFASRRIPKELQEDKVLFGECLSGAMYIEDFRRILLELGCPDFRVVSQGPITISNPEVEEKLSGISFSSITVRAFKLDSLEDKCEDYGQVATYKGSIPGHAGAFTLDDHHVFEAGKPHLVCGNTAAMLEETRFSPHFKLHGNRSKHFGLFDCESPVSSSEKKDSNGACC